MKTWLIVIALILLAAAAVVSLRRDQHSLDSRDDIAGGAMAGGPAFRVLIAVPPSGRALFGMLPNWAEDRIEGAAPRQLSFDQTSPGAELVGIGPERIELRNAGGWELYIEKDGQGRIAPATYVVFPIYLGERHVKLRCRPAAVAVGHLRSQPAGEGKLSGGFRVELEVPCKNASSGKYVEWPGAPLELQGSFSGLPTGGGATADAGR